jgi:hypothetical protein
MAVNVAFGLWLIFRHETKNPNRPLLEKQMREQIAKSIERAAATFTPAPNAFGVSEITVAVGIGKIDAAADEIVAIASRLGGSATKGLPDGGRMNVLADVPSNREAEFRRAIGSIGATSESPTQDGNAVTSGKPGSSAFAEATADKPFPATAEKKSFALQIVEQSSGSH